MSLFYITGTPGSGKSAVCDELKRRGYVAFDTDNDGIAAFYNNETGEAIQRHVLAAERTPAWRKQHTWKAKREAVEKLRGTDDEKPVFLCGVTANDADELWDLFDKVFALIVTDEHALRERIVGRDQDDYGQNPHELATLLEWQQTAAEDYRKLGAVLVDASRPLPEVADEILTQLEEA